MNMRTHPTPRTRGVSLVEALVALAAMAIGMLGIVGMQATLRGNSDLAKQRSEAVRLAQEAVEEWRAMTAMAATAGRVAYSDITTMAPEDIPGTNATYRLTRTVARMDLDDDVADIDTLPRAKSLRVSLNWTDRTGANQSVSLSTAIAGVMSELGATLAVPPADGDLISRPFGRNRGIPYAATQLGDGRSAFKPPQAAGGTVVWVFNDVTGVLQTCAILDLLQPLSAANVGGCVGRAQLLHGYVNFASIAAQATAAEAVAPTGVAFAVEVKVMRTLPGALVVATGSGCFTAPPLAGVSYLAYYCAVPVSANLTDPPIWSGYSIVTSGSLPEVPVAGEKTTCRYTTERSDNAIANVNHPRAYSAVAGPLVNQNFLVVKVVANDASDCPDGPPLPTGTTTYPQPQTPP
jgi:Tfp pilus assembly protein PilV